MPARAWIIFFGVIGAVLIVFPKTYPVLLSLAAIAAIVLVAPSS